MALTSWCSCRGSTCGRRSRASLTAPSRASAQGGASSSMWAGSTSGTPPTRVLTTSSPQLAASSNAMQKASVRDMLRKSWPRLSTRATSACGTCPSSSTRSSRRWVRSISATSGYLGPSPPMMKCTWGNLAHTRGTRSMRRSTPLRYAKRDMTTMLTVGPCGRELRSGWKREESTALGITETRSGWTLARRTVFSLLVCETQIMCGVSASVNSRTLFV
mmetsp:Transcript_28579/g.62582  ORF Transcript_28579/g.62582 Transcript_28579/m.62582 type:complete len:218 (+) Transcript_28579:320-973(+)